jgi:hypothetical protein
MRFSLATGEGQPYSYGSIPYGNQPQVPKDKTLSVRQWAKKDVRIGDILVLAKRRLDFELAWVGFAVTEAYLDELLSRAINKYNKKKSDTQSVSFG